MGFFSSLSRSRDAPQNSTAGSAYTFFFGGSTSGKAVTERSAMQMTAVYSCVRILVEAVAGLPLNLYRYTEDGGKEKAIDHPLYLLLHDEPNLEMSSFVFRETLMTHLLLWGNAYAQVIRNGKGEVVALYPLMPNKMTVDRDERANSTTATSGGRTRPSAPKTRLLSSGPRTCCTSPAWALTGWWATRPSLWRRTPSAWPSPVRSMALSFLPTARFRAVS